MISSLCVLILKLLSMYTLGLATMNNSAAALFYNGKLIIAIENERLSRIKNDASFPFLAIRECLSYCNINFNQIDHIAIYWKPWKFFSRTEAVLKKIIFVRTGISPLLSRVKDTFTTNKKISSHESNWFDLFFIKNILKKEFGPFNAKVNFYDHHMTHKVYSESIHKVSNFLSLSYDGGGEEYSSILSAVDQGKRKIILKHKWPNSLGHYYSTFTGFLGFKMLEGEYKMMGLAPYGKPIYLELILHNVLKIYENGSYKLNTEICDYHSALEGRFNQKMISLFGKNREPDAKPTQKHIDIACSVQQAFELAQQNMLKNLNKKIVHYKDIFISGGCALNVTANGKLLDKKKFNNVFIPPAPHDAGCAIGACIISLKNLQVLIDYDSVKNPYLGPVYKEDEIKKQINLYCKNKVRKSSNKKLTKDVAHLLSKGSIVAWFQGGSEFGPRALGARSFLADPRNDSIREEINKKIKKRELFRPFAPSILEEEVSNFFDFNQKSPYMNVVAKVKSNYTNIIPAVTHVDGTARVHTVSKKFNSIYHLLLCQFKIITGVPVLLNTSFNIQEPIVETPSDAFKSFKSSGVDCLAIGSYLIFRKDLK